MAAKSIALDWNEFLRGNVVPKTPSIGLTGKVYFALAPVATPVSAAQSEAWAKVFDQLLKLADYADCAIIIFSGALWMFGHRSKAIEFLLGSSVGYLIIRHYRDIHNFFNTL